MRQAEKATEVLSPRGVPDSSHLLFRGFWFSLLYVILYHTALSYRAAGYMEVRGATAPTLDDGEGG
jgi:hypothetical protein